MRTVFAYLLSLVLALTIMPTQGVSQSSLLLNQQRNQMMMQQQRMQQQQQQQRMQQQRMQQQRQMQQRQRQQQAMQQRQRQMQNRQRQMQAQRQRAAQQRRAQIQQRKQIVRKPQVQRKQLNTQSVQRITRVNRDRAGQLKRQKRLEELRKRTRLEKQTKNARKAAQSTNTIALLSRQSGRFKAISSPKFQQRRQAASQRFSKLRNTRPPARANGGGSGNGSGNGGGKPPSFASKQLAQKKLQEFRNRQAVKGAKDTKQDVATKNSRLPGPKLDARGAASFKDGQYKNVKLSKEKTLYKYHGINNKTGAKTTWFTNKKYANEAELRKDLAIRKDWGVKISHVSKFRIPKGTWISEGKAASQGNGYKGGGYQAVVNNVPRAWVVRTDKAFK